jgi:hypothetical protein
LKCPRTFGHGVYLKTDLKLFEYRSQKVTTFLNYLNRDLRKQLQKKNSIQISGSDYFLPFVCRWHRRIWQTFYVPPADCVFLFAYLLCI